MQPRLAPRLMQPSNTRIYNDKKNKVCSRDAHTYNVVTIVICHFVIFKLKEVVQKYYQ